MYALPCEYPRPTQSSSLASTSDRRHVLLQMVLWPARILYLALGPNITSLVFKNLISEASTQTVRDDAMLFVPRVSCVKHD